MGWRNGTVKDVVIADELRANVYDAFTWWKPGYVISDFLKDKLGVLFLKFSSEDEMLDKINRIANLVKVIYSDRED